MNSGADEEQAKRFGVAVSVIAALRKGLDEGVHWTADPLGKVTFTLAGENALAEALGVQKKEKGGGAANPAVLLAIARIYPARIWVRVVTPEGTAADVRVRDNLRLQVRMQIQCERLPDGGWRCVHHGLAPL